MDSSLERLKQIRADAIIGKKKHSNASNRKSRYNQRLGISLIVLGILTGSTFYSKLSICYPEVLKWTGSLLGLIISIIAGIQTYIKFFEQVENHDKIVSKYRGLSKKCSNKIAAYNDKLLNDEELLSILDQLTDEYEQISKDAETLNTSNSDYKKAIKGIENGEESYTNKELNG